MLKLKNDKRRQISIFESLLPPELFQLNEELQEVDRLLDDETFMKPFLSNFNTQTGRPTVPVEVYLRLMYLKHRHGLGYRTLTEEVSDSIKWRTFCRLHLDDPVPDPTTLMKSTKRYGKDIIDELNRLLVKKAREKKVIRSSKLRGGPGPAEADTGKHAISCLQGTGRPEPGGHKKIPAPVAAIKTILFNLSRLIGRKNGRIIKSSPQQ